MEELNKAQFERTLTLSDLNKSLQKIEYRGRRYHLQGCKGTYTLGEINRLARKLLRRDPHNIMAATQVAYRLDYFYGRAKKPSVVRRRGIPYPILHYLAGLPETSWSVQKLPRGWVIKHKDWTIQYDQTKLNYPYSLIKDGKTVFFAWDKREKIAVKTAYGAMPIHPESLFHLTKRQSIQDVIGREPAYVHDQYIECKLHLDSSGALLTDVKVAGRRRTRFPCFSYEDASTRIGRLLGFS